MRDLYEVRDVPVLQNRTFGSADEARRCVTGDVVLAQDERTGLISNRAFQSSLVQYDADYQNEQALSAVFRAHLEGVATLVLDHFADRSLIEVGCGKAYFLELLAARGAEIRGVDPAYEGTNPAVVVQPFTPELQLRADGVILRHVLEHIEDPVSFLAAIQAANGGGGDVYIEVPCFDWICEHRAWFDVFYEHVNYFRLADLEAMFGTVHRSGRLFGGQYLFVIADLGSLRAPVRASGDVAAMPDDFTSSIEVIGARFRSEPGRLSIWGAASKGVIFSLHLQRAGIDLNVAIDVNPQKQNRYLPVTGIPVIAPEEALRTLAPGSPIAVMNSNYLSEIRAVTEERYPLMTVEHVGV
jgi:hypothetical protein